MKKLLSYCAVALVAALLFFWTSAEAQRLPPEQSFRNTLGIVTSDTMNWFGAGTSATTSTGHTDSLFSTGRDSTYAVQIGGAESVVLELHTRPAGGADSINVLFTFQVASSPDTTAMWHSLSATFTALPLTNARDTIAVVLASPFLSALPDTSAATALATAQGGMITVPLADRALVNASRYLRVIMRGLGQAADSVLVTSIATIRYPR